MEMNAICCIKQEPEKKMEEFNGSKGVEWKQFTSTPTPPCSKTVVQCKQFKQQHK